MNNMKEKLFYRTSSLINFILSLITDYLNKPYSLTIDNKNNVIILDVDKSKDSNKISFTKEDLDNEDISNDKDKKYNHIEFFKSIEIDFDFNYPIIMLPFSNLEKKGNVIQVCKKHIIESKNNTSIIVISASVIEEELRVDIENEIKQYSHELRTEHKVIFIDEDKLKKIVEFYRINHVNSLDGNELYNNKYVSEIEKNDFEKYKNNLIEKLVNTEMANNLALVLGAGVSCSEGALSWNDMVKNFEKILVNKLKIKSVLDKIGDTNLIATQLYKELLPKESYYKTIYNSIYKNYSKPQKNSDTLLENISILISKLREARNFRVMTYNYDNYVEQYLKIYNMKYNVIFDVSDTQNINLPIYHVHGYLPMVKNICEFKSDKNDEFKHQIKYLSSIKLTEDDYNILYNDAYSWQIGVQLSFFRENRCLFVGCSLKDPNIRRLLRMAEKQQKRHFAIINKGDMEKENLVIATNHFYKMGIYVIWISNHDDCKNIVKRLATSIPSN